LEETLVLSFLGLQSGFDQIDKNTACAGLLGFGQCENPFRKARR
jgi:hypothetical protein